jgi:hypothetical protein
MASTLSQLVELVELSSALPFDRFHRIRLHSLKDFALSAQISLSPLRLPNSATQAWQSAY